LSHSVPDERSLMAELDGNTLSVYCYLLSKRRNSVGVRQLQRALGFSSSSTAHYHLEKLRDLGLIQKSSLGDYSVSRVIKVGVLSACVFVAGHALPKHLIYATATSLMILLFAALFANSLSLTVLGALLPGIVAAVIFWYETVTVWQRLRSARIVGSTDPQERSKV